MTIDVARCSHGIVRQNNLCALKLYTIGRTQVIRIFAQGMLYVKFKCKQLFVRRCTAFAVGLMLCHKSSTRRALSKREWNKELSCALHSGGHTFLNLPSIIIIIRILNA